MRNFFALMVSLSFGATSASAETVADFDTLVHENSGRAILVTEILEDGEVVILISRKNSEVPEYICEFHRKLSNSYNDKCRKIGG